MRNFRKHLTALTIVLAPTLALAQHTIRGTVSDVRTGEPLIGASVIVKTEKTHGAVTDIDGRFSILTKKEAPLTLRVEYLGYRAQDVDIYDFEEDVPIQLTENLNLLEGVVITVPYGQTKKSSFTGSAGLIDSKTIEQAQVSNVTKALEGTVAGLQSFSSTGQPGSEATILIRGIGSVNASSTPLFVVDGIPYDGSLNSIASSDIESITVLKDAASATLYGSRAANGVVMITTRQGQKGQKAQIELSAKYGWSSRAREDYKQVDTQTWLELFHESLRNYRQDQGYSAEEAAQWATKNFVSRLGINPFGTNYPEPIGTDGKIVDGATLLWDDDWDEAMQQDAHYADVNLRISGGGERSKYFFSVGYLDDQGAYKGSNFSRYSVRANIETEVNKWLEAGLNLSGSYTDQDNPPQTSVQLLSPIFFARNMRGWMPIYQRDLATGEYLLDEYGNKQYDYGNYRLNNYKGFNLVSTIERDKWNYKRENASVRGFALLKPFKGFTYKFSINVDYRNQNYLTYRNPSVGKYAASSGSMTRSNTRTTGVTLNNVVNYSHTFAQLHNLHLMAGQEYYEYNTGNISGSGTNILTDGYYEPDMMSTITDFSGSSNQYKLLSYFGNVDYNYDEKYFASASVRTDGSSRFSPDHRWGTFWSVSASWKLIREEFLKNQLSWLSDLTLRTSYGAQGNDNVGGYYAYQGLFSVNNNLGNSGLRASRLATPDLTWETNLHFNVGLDFGLFNNRLVGSVEYFVRRSKDLLFSIDLVPSSGYSSSNQNIGAIKNEGWEFTLTAFPVNTKDWKWRIGANLTTYKNKITDLPAEEMWSGDRKWVKGGSLYDLYVVEWAGVNPENGNGQWWYTNAQGERVKTESYATANSNSNKVYVGSSLPTVSGGINTELTWRSLTLSALFSFSLGGKIINNDYSHIMQQGGHWYAWSEDILDRWTPEHTQTDVAKLTYSPQKTYSAVDSHFLQSNSYGRLKTITLSYALPRQLLRPAGITATSVFLQGENLLTICGIQGLDPEQAYDGTSNFRYPAMKTVSVGLNVKF
ncbi:MAG: TonB-dependent receptor [Prevotella sp.]|nr:TonB-dependent receptor [Prevotella sp.]